MGPCHVLIESDWNLKSVWVQATYHARVVLIESDWNLKLFDVTMPSDVIWY